MKPQTAIIYTGSFLSKVNGKLAHGLIRGTDRFEITGIIDEEHAGKDAGEIIAGTHREIPIFADIDTALKAMKVKPEVCIIAVATPGGRITPALTEFVYSVLKSEISVISCLHEYIANDPKALRLAHENKVYIHDVRKPKALDDLHFFSGDILSIKTPRIALLGTDCALGKRTSGYMLRNTLRETGTKAEMIYTGQTGWLQGMEYGFILDATPNDFVGGELEYQVLSCDREKSPDVILIEGQASLRNPSGPCGSELLLSAQAEGVILQHDPKRPYFEPVKEKYWPIPSIESEIELIRMYGSKVLAITLNESHFYNPNEWGQWKRHLQKELRIPVFAPLSEGVDELAKLVVTYIRGVRENEN